MSDTAFIDEAGVAAEIRARFAQDRLADKRRIWRVSVATGVLILHLLVILWMVSGKFVATPVKMEPPHKTELIWLLAPKKAPEGVKAPTEKSDIIEQVYKAVQLLNQAPQVDRPNAITMDPGLALGQALACGAGQYEYLTPEGKRHCKTPPWTYTYDRDGFIILRTPGMPRRRKERKIPPHEQELHDRMYTTPNCANGAANNGPCLGGLTPH